MRRTIFSFAFAHLFSPRQSENFASLVLDCSPGLTKTFLICLGVLTACSPNAEEQAAQQMKRIDSLYAAKNYAATLDAIRKLRHDHPKAVEARRRALKIWQEASLRLAQGDIGRTDSALQVTNQLLQSTTDIATRNKLRVRRDSLQVRYDALCGTVRIIHRRQAESEE